MSLSFNFNFGRLLSNTEKLTPAKLNAIVKGIVATLTGTVGTSDLDAGAVTPAKTTAGAYFYATGTLSASTYTATYTPAISSYTDGLVLAFKAGSANSGAANLDAGGGAKPLRRYAGGVLETGNIKAGQIVEVRYNSTLVAGGCFEITSLLGEPEAAVAPPSGFQNLFWKTGIIYNTQLQIIRADGVVLKTASGSPRLVTISSTITITITTSGLNGLDTGAEANSTWYYIWLIYNPTTGTAGGLLSTSATAPTLPSGYTYYGLLGAVYNNSSGNLIHTRQIDRTVYMEEQVIFTATTGTTAWTLYDISALVPPIARKVFGNMGSSASGAFSIAAAGGPVAPDTEGTTLPIGVCRGQAGNSSIAAFDGFVNAVPFSVEWHYEENFFATSRLIFFAMGNTTASHYRATVRGFEI